MQYRKYSKVKLCYISSYMYIYACGSLNCSFIMTYVMLTTFIIQNKMLCIVLKQNPE